MDKLLDIQRLCKSNYSSFAGKYYFIAYSGRILRMY